jgi:hypothetical protein
MPAARRTDPPRRPSEGYRRSIGSLLGGSAYRGGRVDVVSFYAHAEAGVQTGFKRGHCDISNRPTSVHMVNQCYERERERKIEYTPKSIDGQSGPALEEVPVYERRVPVERRPARGRVSVRLLPAYAERREVRVCKEENECR